MEARALRRALEHQAAADVEMAMKAATLLAAGRRQHEVQHALGLSQRELRAILERLRKIAPAIEREHDLDTGF